MTRELATIGAGHDLHDMDESQNGEEDLLSFLQPLTMPDEFAFEPRTRHFEDSSDEDVAQEPIPGPAPPAPMALMAPTSPAAPLALMAPMAPMEAVETTIPAVAVAPEAETTKADGAASSQPPETNGHEENKTVSEHDEDAIEYEKPKPPRKSPAKWSARSRATPKARKIGGDESADENATGLLKYFSTSLAKKRGGTNADPDSDLETNGGNQLKTRKGKSRETTVSEGVEAGPAPEPLKFEVVIQPLPPAATQEYTKVTPGDEIYRVLDVIRTDVPGEAWLSVEFEDGRVDQVSHKYRTVFLHLKVDLAPLAQLFFIPSRFTWQQSKWKATMQSFTS